MPSKRIPGHTASPPPEKKLINVFLLKFAPILSPNSTSGPQKTQRELLRQIS